MSTTIIDNLQSDGSTPPIYPYLRTIAGVNHFNNTISEGHILPDGGLATTPSPSSITPFGRSRSAAPFSLFDSKQIYAKDTLFWVESLTNSGTATFQTNQATTRLAVIASAGSSAIRQTRQYMIYQPGQGQLIFLTGLMIGAEGVVAGITRQIGYFDASNGVFFQHDGTDLSVVRRSNVTGTPVDVVYPQSTWNIDPLDGTGPSGITINVGKVQVYVIDFSWLGVGIIRWGILYASRLIYCHQFVAANNITTVWDSTPCLPMRYELTNVTGANIASMDQTCGAVFSEGGLDPLGLIVSADNGTTGITVSNIETALMSVRLNSTYRRATIIPMATNILSVGNNNIIVKTYIRATVSGGSWIPTTGVASEVNITPTGFSTTNAILIGTSYISGSTTRAGAEPVRSSLVLSSDFAGTTRDELVITAANLATGNNLTYISMEWKELY